MNNATPRAESIFTVLDARCFAYANTQSEIASLPTTVQFTDGETRK